MTATGIVANGRSWPQVVHRPHHGLTAIQYLFDVGKAQHSLIYPMKMNHVGLLELRQRRNVVARIGYVDIEKPLSLEMQMTEYAPPFPQETPTRQHLSRQADHRNIVRFPVSHQHLGLHAIIIERVFQSVGRHSSTARPFACVHNQYSHLHVLYIMYYKHKDTTFFRNTNTQAAVISTIGIQKQEVKL